MVNDKDAITRWLISQVAQGNAVLFLGAGASLASEAAEGRKAPDGKALARAISEEFIHEYNDWPLATAAAYAEAVVGRAQVEMFVREQLKDLIPSSGLQVLANMPWRSIYTTNFDELLEEAYRIAGGPYKIRPIFTSRTPLRDMARGEIAYYKLHGCISRAGEAEGHPVLTAEDLCGARTQSDRLFRRLMDDLAEYTILYVGYGREDPDFHEIMSQVSSEMGGVQNLRPSFALAPGYKDYHQRLWEARKIHLIDDEAEEFLPWLADECKRADVAPMRGGVRPITFFIESASPDIVSLVRAHFEVPAEEAEAGTAEFTSFFRGNRPSWGQLAGNCDAKRDLTDEAILAAAEAEARRETGPILILIRAEGGNGKTTMLRRMGIDLATVWDLPVLSLRDTASLEFEVVDAAARQTDRRLVVLVDDAADRAHELSGLLESARRAKTKVTVIAAGRTNELRAKTAELDLGTPIIFEPGLLSENEIAHVLAKLEEFGELGVLAHMSPEQRSHEFRQRAERQLLVAMREATEGKQFDAIVQDEYDGIPADDSRLAYLYICSLYQTKVPLRAGVLRRLMDVPFEEFQERILRPAHGIIVEEEDPEGVVYRARHPVIAQIVVAHKLPTGPDRLAMYTRMLDALDLGYEEDLTAFRRISRNRELVDGLAAYDLKMDFYSACHNVNPDDPYVLQHWAIACMDEGRFGRAEELLNKAREIYPRDISIQHSLGMLSFRRYVAEIRGAWADLHFSRAEETFRRLIRRVPSQAAAYDSLARLLM